jgi:basic membrane protein A
MRKFVRLFAVLAILSLVAAACASDNGDGGGSTSASASASASASTLPGEGITVGLTYDLGGRGDLSFNDSAAAGLDKAVTDFGITAQELEPNQGGTNRAELLDLLASQGANMIIGVGFLYAETVCAAAAKYPDVNFGDVDGFINKDTANCPGAHDLTASDNLASLLFAEEQGSFLVGAAAALKSTTGHIGFIGGVDIDLIHKFEAGYTAGAQQVNPDIKVDIKYISQPPDFSGFNDPAKGKEIAASMYQNGADIVYAAAGGSGLGVFEAAKEYSDSSGTQVWAIGVDSDQYMTAPPELQPYILTSMLKRVDVAVYETIKAQVEGTFEGGYQTFDLSKDGVGYSTSGGFIDDIVPQLEDLKQQIIDGTITVPTS